MVVKNESQALCIAVEMEKRAIRVYERALMLVQDADVQRGIREILGDEKQHLRRFMEMRANHPLPETEEHLLLSAMAAEVLFTGGVMELNREQALQDLLSVYRYAAESEAEAVRTYAEYANQCEDPVVREAFMSIVREESQHLVQLRERIRKMSGESA